MNTDSLRYVMRQRLHEYKIVDVNKDFHPQNGITLNTEGKLFWMDEQYLGDTEQRFSDLRRKPFTAIMMYSLYVPIGTGTKVLSEKQDEITNCFDIMDNERSYIETDDLIAEVFKMTIGEDSSDEQWTLRPVSIHMRISPKKIIKKIHQG